MRIALRVVIDNILAAVIAIAILPLTTAVAGAQQLPRENPSVEQRELRDKLEAGQKSGWVEESGEDVDGRSYWFEYQRRYPFDVVPAGAHKRAIDEMHRVRDRMASATAKSPRLFSSNQWTEIGPTNLGGRVRAIAIHPTQSEIIFVGGVAGGVWKTADGGATWRTTFDKQTSLTVGAIAIDPSNPENVYVGTGELCVGSTIAFMADGMFKSSDGGETWRNIGLNSLVAISKIHVHKDNPRIVYVAAGRIGSNSRYAGGGLGAGNGFYRSTDAGATWSQQAQGHVIEMAVNPLDNDEVVIATPRSVSRSRDGGANFVEINSGIANLSTTLRISLAFDPLAPTNVYALQAYNGGDVHLGNLYRSTNGGDNWSLVSALDSSIFRTQGQYDNCLAVDPSNPNNILAGGIDLWRSTNAGLTFVNETLTYGSTRDRDFAHPDQHVIVYDRSIPGVVYVGSDGGVYQSFSSGDDFVRLHAELPITQFYAMEIDQSRPYRVYGGTQDNQTHGGFGSETEHNKEWAKLLGGDGFLVVVDNTDRDIIYAEQPYGQLYRIDVRNANYPMWIVGGINNDGGSWCTPIAISSVDGRLYSGRSKVYRTSNPRSSQVAWQQLDPDYTNGGSKTVALGLSPHDAGRIIVGNDAGDVRFTNDDGVSWLKSEGLPSRVPTDLCYDPVDPKRVYVTISGFRAGHVFVSDDYGASFRDITANIPDIPVNTIEIDPENNSHLFVGTDIGVFASLDAGTTWFPFNEGMPVVPVADMRIHRSRRVLIAATHGRSLLEVGIDGIAAPAVLLSPAGGETFATPGSITVRWSGFTGLVDVAISYRNGEPFTTVASGVVGDSLRFEIGLVRSTTARVRVESSGGSSATSGAFTLSATVNIETLGKRGFVAEAIAYRQNQLWVTVRGSDTIRRMNLPGLTGIGVVRRSGFSGTVRDLAYDAVRDEFYALVADSEATSARVFRFDTTGAVTDSITLPASITAASGIEVVSAGLAVATSGETGRIAIVDVESGAELSSHPYDNALGDWRRGLARVGRTFAQGVVRFDAGLDFPSELQLLADDDTARLYEALPMVLPSGNPVYFFDIASDDTSATAMYYATDTSGVFYRVRNDQFSAVESAVSGMRSLGIQAHRVIPNPASDDAILSFHIDRSELVTVEIVSAIGTRMLTTAARQIDAGGHRQSIDVRSLAAGMYYVVITAASGDRATLPMIITR